MNFEIKQADKFKFIEEGEGEPLILLHGLFGALSNFSDLVNYFRHHNKVVVPMLPLLDLDLLHTSVGGLQKFVHKFIEHRNYQNVHLLGNSLGGHVAILHVLKQPERIKSLILTGSSGLFENGMGDTYPKRGDYDYIKKKTELTFYDPRVASKELVDEVYETVNNRLKAIKIIALAKSAIRNNLGEELNQIKQPTLLVWGPTMPRAKASWVRNHKSQAMANVSISLPNAVIKRPVSSSRKSRCRSAAYGSWCGVFCDDIFTCSL